MLLKNLCAATILALASAPVLAAECSVDIAGNDQMHLVYEREVPLNTTEKVPEEAPVTVTLCNGPAAYRL